MPRLIPAVSVAVAAVLLLAGCAPGGSGDETPRGAAPGDPAATQDWPDPADDRPVVELSYAMADDLRSAAGTERVTFVPDRQVCELVFRAWPNKPATAATGNALTVTSVTVDGSALTVQEEPAGAPEGSPGTLVEVTLPECREAGSPVTAELTFDLALGADTDERTGYSTRERVAWFATGFPTLAWVDGVGWTRDEAVAVAGEMTTTEAFRLASLQVQAPDGDAVMGIGERQEPRPGPQPGTTVHEFSADVVRDVSVTVGAMDLHEETVGEQRLTLALPPGSRGGPEVWSEVIGTRLARLSELLGPVPADHLWVSVLPGVTDGVEVGAAVQFGDIDPEVDAWLVTHELAHLWFYGLVGNNQAQDPWLDEAFATWAQEVVDPAGTTRRAMPGAVGAPMSDFAEGRRSSDRYVGVVYLAGANALSDARAAAGEDAFDEAIRAYLHDNAWQVATPEDLAEALADLPAAGQVLEDRGAF